MTARTSGRNSESAELRSIPALYEFNLALSLLGVQSSGSEG